MSNRKNLVFIILFFLILFAFICILVYKTFFYEEKTKQVMANKEISIEEQKKEIDKVKEKKEEPIIIILNAKIEDDIAEPQDENQQENNTVNEDKQNKEQIDNPQVENNNQEQIDNSQVENNDEQQTASNQENESMEFYIKVNYGSNVINVYSKDENGNYTVPCKAFICSTGRATPTSGAYNTDYKYRWVNLFGNVYGQYATRIVGNILFHSVPYLEKGNHASLEYWEYDKLRNSCFYGMYKNDCRGR